MAFLEKLFDIVSNPENQAYIAWQPAGDSFLIRDVNGLQNNVLPRFFKHSNLQSLARQLNLYGFNKTAHDPQFREFRNPHFLRGRRELLGLIKRKGQGSSKDEAEPSDHSHSHIQNSSPSTFDGEALHDGPDAGGEERETIEDLRERVRVLETKTYVLSERYHELAVKHDTLCTTLQTVFHLPRPAVAGGGSSSCSGSSGGRPRSDDDDNKPRALSECTLSEEEGLCPGKKNTDNALTRMISIDPTRDEASAPSHSFSHSSSSFSLASKRSVSECAGHSGDHRHLLLEALTSSTRLSALPLGGVTINIGASSLGRGTPGRGLLDLVDAATFSVHAPTPSMAGRPLERMATIATSTLETGARGARKRTKVDGDKLSRMNTY